MTRLRDRVAATAGGAAARCRTSWRLAVGAGPPASLGRPSPITRRRRTRGAVPPRQGDHRSRSQSRALHDGQSARGVTERRPRLCRARRTVPRDARGRPLLLVGLSAVGLPESAQGRADVVKLLTVAQTALLLGLSEDTIRALVRRGTLPHVSLGIRAIRIPADALDATLARLTSTSAEPASAQRTANAGHRATFVELFRASTLDSDATRSGRGDDLQEDGRPMVRHRDRPDRAPPLGVREDARGRGKAARRHARGVRSGSHAATGADGRGLPEIVAD